MQKCKVTSRDKAQGNKLQITNLALHFVCEFIFVRALSLGATVLIFTVY